ncbi:MAG: efflux transporter outer membrane subunit [Proteobacteria bacterium]|nr:efflux transporter outer membrane subunit [Pseudomonadota bacterium]
MAATLAACSAVGPDYRAPEIRMPEQWREAGPEKAAGDPRDLIQWWKTLGDPTLDRLVERALANNLDMKKAVSRLEEAKARRGAAGAARAPSVSASGSASSSRVGESDDIRESYALGLDVSWEADLFGGLRRARDAAQADYEASIEDLRDVLVSLIAEAATNYVQLRTGQMRLSAAENNLKLQTETHELVRLKYETGLSGGLDLDQATYNLETTRAQIPALRKTCTEAKNRLAVLMGVYPGELESDLADPGGIPSREAGVVAGVPADLLRRRPDIRRAERQLAAETARVGEAEADRYPQLSLKGGLTYQALALSGLISPANLVASLSTALSWKLFQAGAVAENIKARTALQEQALLEYKTVVLGAVEETENAMTALARENERRESLAKATRAAGQAADLAVRQYQSGLSDFQNVLETQRSLASFQDSLVESQGSMTLNRILLYKALGGGWSNENLAPREPPATVPGSDRSSKDSRSIHQSASSPAVRNRSR